MTLSFTLTRSSDIDIIMHSRRSILIHNGSPWVKKDKDGMFDVTMGSFDGAEASERVGLFILNDLANKYGTNNIGVYRDDTGSLFLGILQGPRQKGHRRK